MSLFGKLIGTAIGAAAAAVMIWMSSMRISKRKRTLKMRTLR